jgi:ABC-type polysaccharide/polyol phosphate transport system ATPase subunit
VSDTVITVEHLSKRYLVGHQAAGRERYTALRDVIGREARNFVRKAGDLARGRHIIQGDEVEEFWALKDVSFEVKRGEVVGIIGRNGAGKSTLLKILSRITEPTKGRVRLRGRVASLLEVGTGFHPELTGRENIFLNGAVLGMRRADIKRKFDEIVAFAGTERFLDVPIKRYSSGMYVRLAFALAAHVEPDILIVDEVLAVGDHEFQQKCLGKMHDVASQEGRTVLLVSHQLAAIGEMAKRTLLLDSGRIIVDGAVETAISTYLSKGASAPIYIRPTEKHSRAPHLRKAEVLTSEPGGTHEYGRPLTIKSWIKHDIPMARGYVSFQIINQYQQPIIHTFPDFGIGTQPGETQLVCHFPNLKLNVGQFYLRTWLSEPPGAEHYEALDGLCLFEVVRTDEQVLWGWRPDVCAYHEECSWTRVDSSVRAEAV